jgi:hypothetical protein
MEERFRSSIPDNYEQWLAFHDNGHIQKFTKILQDLTDFKVWLNEGHIFLEWSDLKKNNKLINLVKVSSTSHPEQELFRHLRSYFIHDMVGPYVFYFSQLDNERVKSTSEWAALQMVPQR